jgi:glycosyltransferase involved in cell wall biosynthesis
MASGHRLLIRSHWSLHNQPTGGADLLMHNIATALTNSGWDVDILCPRPDNSEIQNNMGRGDINYHNFNYSEPQSPVRKMVNSVRGWKTYRNIVYNNNYDILLDDISHIPFYPLHLDHPGTAVDATFMHTAFFDSAWEFDTIVGGTVINLIDRYLSYLDSHIICAGPSTANRMEEIGGCTDTYVLKPCIDLEKFEYKFDPDSKNVLFLGRLTQRKNADCLLRAWKHIENTYDEYTLTIAGTGNRDRQLKQLADDLGLKNVTFAGFVTEERKIELFRNAFVFVLPSLIEGYVTTGIEALASGTPVVGSDTYGINDYIIDGKNGLLFETDKPMQLAGTLRYAIENRGELRSMARTGRRLAESHSFESFQSQSDLLFSSITNKRT